MGYRSTIISQDYGSGLPLPKWFTKKYKDELNMGVGFTPVSSKYERKFYGMEEDEMLQDFRKVLAESDAEYLKKTGVDFALLHEDGAINRVTVTATEVKFDDDTIGIPL